ncbi:MAG: tetratricopeptide repeat protein [Acidobacteria bacterium]|nr:tetratricopeptide repeat protein [Acidobacteriota bacterium]
MLFPLLLAAMFLLPVAGSAFAQAGPSSAEAIQLANEGRDAEALAAFRRVAAADPNDHEARLWIARLHERMGSPDQAESVYRSVLLEDPANVEAALGVAATLLAQQAPDEALEVLEPAEERDPRNATVLALLGRAHRMAGHTGLAVAYFERAVAVAPTDEHRLRLNDARRSYMHRVDTHAFSEQFSGPTPNSRSGDVALNYRLSDRLRVLGRGQVERKFAISEQRGGGGAEWRWMPTTTLRAQVLVGPDNRVMPEGDYLGELVYTFGRATWTGGFRYFDFTGARMSVFSPAVSWLASERLELGLMYAIAWREATTLPADEFGHTVHVRGAYRLMRPMWVQVGYAAGIEDFEKLTSDRVQDFRANTVSGGLRIDMPIFVLPTLTTFIANYEHQWRSRSNVNMGRVSVGLQQRF